MLLFGWFVVVLWLNWLVVVVRVLLCWFVVLRFGLLCCVVVLFDCWSVVE